jgi:hypothetical protein
MIPNKHGRVKFWRWNFLSVNFIQLLRPNRSNSEMTVDPLVGSCGPAIQVQR